MSTELEQLNNNPAALAGFEGGEIGHVQEREVGAAAAVAREEAEIKSAIFLARQFPRNEFAAYNKVIKACERPGLAEEAVYNFPRGGQQVSGPSVNLAREIARCWGNIRYGLRVVSVDEDMVHIRGYAFDLETNAYVEHEDKFEKLVYRKGKGWVKPDERDLRELINRRGAILVRNAILQVVPSDVVDAAEEKAKETLRRAAAGEISQNREQAIRRLVKAFDGIGVTVEMLEGYLKHGLDAITADEIADLRAVYKSIQDGHSRREEYFDLKAPSAASQELNASLSATNATDEKQADKNKGQSGKGKAASKTTKDDQPGLLGEEDDPLAPDPKGF